jgi:hypothetical protein
MAFLVRLRGKQRDLRMVLGSRPVVGASLSMAAPRPVVVTVLIGPKPPHQRALRALAAAGKGRGEAAPLLLHWRNPGHSQGEWRSAITSVHRTSADTPRLRPGIDTSVMNWR